MKHSLIAITISISVVATFCACKKDNGLKSDEEALYKEISNTSVYSYYAGTPGITEAAGNSPHGYERVRFNSIAYAALDSTGKLPIGAVFPQGSIIVKDIYSGANGSINLYALMKKDTESEYDASGYVWAEFNTDGSTAYSLSNKGSGCISCHSAIGNRDLVMSFILH